MTTISFEKNPKQEVALDKMLSYKFTLLFGGSRSGKSFIIMWLIMYRALKKKSRHLVFRLHFSDVKRTVINETFIDVAKIMGVKYKLNLQDFYAEFQNGSQIWFCGADQGRGLDKVLGAEYSTIWGNEVSQIPYATFTILKTRLAQKSGLVNRYFLDENPPSRLHWSYKIFFEGMEPKDNVLLKNPEQYTYLKMDPADNKENIDEDYIAMLESLPKEERKRFYEGEFSEIEEGALFSEANINQYRVVNRPEMKKVVVAVDPAASENLKSDETGIIVVGADFGNRGYMLEDVSGIYSPKQWADKAKDMYVKWKAVCVVAERNMGGSMVKHTLKTSDENIPVKTVHAMDGKKLRASPISALYEDGRISHVGVFPDCETEMALFTGKKGEKSPNRLDALVYGFTELFPVGVYSDSEIFNRDNLKYWGDYDFTNSYDFTYIKITGADSKGANYNFLALYAKIKDGKIFITDCIFNSMLPADNLEQLKNKFVGSKRQFLECAPSFASFAKELKSMKIPTITVKEFTHEDNMIISESGFIKDTFVFEKDSDSTYYKSYMTQLHGYTTTAEANESVAAAILPSMAYVTKKLLKRHLNKQDGK